MNNTIKQKFDYPELRQYILDHPDAKIFFGCDSQRFKKDKVWHARYIVCAIVYEKDDNKIFAEISVEKDYDSNPGKPALRLMNEVYKVSETVRELADVLEDRKFEVHLDINPNILHGSSCVINQATGYILGVNGIKPVVKPDSWAASCVSDHLVKHQESRKYK